MNKTQEAMNQLMRCASFNNFDGDMVADNLEDNHNLFRGYVFGRFDYATLIPLRDIENDVYNADTLYILPAPDKEDELEKLVRDTFKADEVDWESEADIQKEMGFGGRTSNSDKYVLRVWWD